MTLEDQLKRDEGLRLRPYKDTVGKTTIGIGRNLDDVGISEEEALVLLANDIKRADDALSEAFPWTLALDDARRAVLVNMTFNMGIHGLAQFRHFLAAVEAGSWTTARVEMLDSKWADQVGARAQRLAIQLESGEWQ